jgi:hypothetical protein
MKKSWLLWMVLCCMACVNGLDAQGYAMGEGYYFPRVLKGKVDARMAHKGQFEEGLTWKDASGDNTLILCYDRKEQQQQRDIYVYQYRVADGKCSLVWDLQDFGSPLCEMTMVPNSLQLIDLDNDGILEACFMYQNLCDGLDPYVTKLMLFKGGEKLAVRGKFSVEEREELERTVDTKAAQYPPVFKNFMLLNWEEFKEEDGLRYAKSVAFRTKDYMVLEKEYLLASGGTEYQLLDADGMPMAMPKGMDEKIQWPEALDMLPDGRTLLYADVTGVGTYDPVTQKETVFMTFLEGTEAVSMLSWSPDGRKFAFVALNPNEYPEGTRVFVITLAGNAMAGKEKFDAQVMRMAASDWVVEPVKFRDNLTIEYGEMVVDEEGVREGEVRVIKLK